MASYVDFALEVLPSINRHEWLARDWFLIANVPRMSQMLAYTISEDFQAAIQKSLPHGELVREISDGFFCSWENVWNDFLNTWQRKDWVSGTSTIAVTNVALRLVGFKHAPALTAEQEAKKQRLLQSGMSEDKAVRKAIGMFGSPALVPVPEVASMTSYQISDISAINYQETSPAKFVKKWAGDHIAEIGILTFSCRGETLTINSLFANFGDVYRNLEAAKSGAAIASSITAVEASLSRLKALFDEGVITGSEFDQAKKAFVGTAADVPESIASTLRQLNGLHIDGILSEAEYRAKKFDVLSRLES